MKKFYTLALAAAVALTAAAERQIVANLNPASVEIQNAKTNLLGSKRQAAVTSLPVQTKTSAAPSKAPATVADVESLSDWIAGSLLGQGGEFDYEMQAVVVDEKTGEVQILLRGAYPVKATLDAAAGTLTIPNMQYIKDDEDGPVYFYLKSVTSDGELDPGATDDEATVGTFVDGEFVFPQFDIWAYGDPENETLGWYFLTYNNIFTKDFWYSLGEGEFLENILYASFTGEENTEYAKVEVMADGRGNYKVMNPLSALLALAGAPADAQGPALILNAQDGDNVMFAVTQTGLGNEGTEYLYFSESWYYESLPDDAKEEEYPEGFDDALRIVKTVDGDNVTITFPEGCATLTDSNYSRFLYAAEYESVLKFTEKNSAISGVEAEEADAPAVYYNLQGVRVQNPANGVVIRVQGGKATKVLVK